MDRSSDVPYLSFASVGLQITLISVIVCFYLKYSDVLDMYLRQLEDMIE